MVKKGRFSLTALALLAAPVFCAAALENPRDRVEISLTAGYGKSFVEARSAYHAEWSSPSFLSIVENDQISLDPAAAVYGGGFCSFFIGRQIGIQAGFGYLKSSMSGETLFDFSYLPGQAAARRERWEGRGEITAVPLCLNVIGRAGRGRFRLYASGGIALFLNSFLADSFAGAGGTATLGASPEKIDAFKIPVAVADETWTSLGGNIGGGFDIKISRTAAFTVDVRYFYCPSKTLRWAWESGVYDGLNNNISRTSFDSEAARLAGQKTTPLEVRPSFFQASAGIKFYLPGTMRISAGGKT